MAKRILLLCGIILITFVIIVSIKLNKINSYIRQLVTEHKAEKIAEEKFLELENKFKCGICYKVFSNSEYSNSFYIEMGEVIRMCNICLKYCIQMNKEGYWKKHIMNETITWKPKIIIEKEDSNAKRMESNFDKNR